MRKRRGRQRISLVDFLSSSCRNTAVVNNGFVFCYTLLQLILNESHKPTQFNEATPIHSFCDSIYSKSGLSVFYARQKLRPRYTTGSIIISTNFRFQMREIIHLLQSSLVNGFK